MLISYEPRVWVETTSFVSLSPVRCACRLSGIPKLPPLSQGMLLHNKAPHIFPQECGSNNIWMFRFGTPLYGHCCIEFLCSLTPYIIYVCRSGYVDDTDLIYILLPLFLTIHNSTIFATTTLRFVEDIIQRTCFLTPYRCHPQQCNV